jgi:hypothetical protein
MAEDLLLTVRYSPPLTESTFTLRILNSTQLSCRRRLLTRRIESIRLGVRVTLLMRSGTYRDYVVVSSSIWGLWS